jgi:hypothetical protein
VDTKDRNPQHFVWKINSAAARRKEIKALGAETIYVPDAGSAFAGAICVGASSAGSGNGFVQITCAGLTALTQTDESALFVVTPIMIWPRSQSSEAPTLATGPIAEAHKTARRRLARV